MTTATLTAAVTDTDDVTYELYTDGTLKIVGTDIAGETQVIGKTYASFFAAECAFYLILKSVDVSRPCAACGEGNDQADRGFVQCEGCDAPVHDWTPCARDCGDGTWCFQCRA